MEPEEEDPTESSAEEISDGQAEDMLSDLHNLLYFHGPLQGGELAGSEASGEVGQDDPSRVTLNPILGSYNNIGENNSETLQEEQLVEEASGSRASLDNIQQPEEVGAAGGAGAEEDTLPERYHYLRNLEYNQPRQPRRGDIIKYFDFDFDGWLRVRVISQHKKTSRYAGSVNCVWVDIDREPDGLYFHPGDFWSIIQKEDDDPEPIEEAEREEVLHQVTLTVSPTHSLRESTGGELPLSGAASGLPPVVTGRGSIEPNMVYTIPPPPASVFYSREVIERARRLNLHPDQEYMRYSMAQALTHQERKHSSVGVFAKLRKLGSGRK